MKIENLGLNVDLAHYPPSLESLRPELVFAPSDNPPSPPVFQNEKDDVNSMSSDESVEYLPFSSLIELENEESSNVDSANSIDSNDAVLENGESHHDNLFEKSSENSTQNLCLKMLENFQDESDVDPGDLEFPPKKIRKLK